MQGSYAAICAQSFFAETRRRSETTKVDHASPEYGYSKAGAAYEPAQGRALYRRVCVLTFADADALMRHRSTESHKQKVREDRRASYCHLCKKQFTSATQLKEHLAGKRHNELLETSKAH